MCSFEENGKFWFCSDNRKNIRDEKIQNRTNNSAESI